MPSSTAQADPVAARIALETMIEAYKALAMVYEAACPGRYVGISFMMKQHLAEFMRRIENELGIDALPSAGFESAVREIRATLIAVEQEVVQQPVADYAQTSVRSVP